MAKENIFSKIPELSYSELSDYNNPEEFDKLVNARRSCREFGDDPVPEEVMMEVLNWGLIAPNSSNLQPWQFIWVKSKDKKAKLVEYCLGQPAAATAQEIIVAVARPDMWKITGPKMLEKFKEQKDVKVPKTAIHYYKKLVPMAYNQGPFGIFGPVKKIVLNIRGLSKPTPRGPSSNRDMKTWAHKSTALACQNIMLGFRAHGFDTCPMEGLDAKKIHKLLDLNRKAEVCMAISVGKRAKNGIYGPRVRFESDLFLKTI